MPLFLLSLAAPAVLTQEPPPAPPVSPATIAQARPEVIIVRAERLGSQGAADTGSALTGEALASLPTVRLDEALRAFPGVGLFRRTASGVGNATIQGVSLRPIAPNGAGRALVSLDGVPQNDPFGGWIYWTRYDPLFLAGVDVQRGGAGAGFGPQALLGTLDLYEARDLATRTRASLASQSNIALSARSGVSAGIGDLVVMGGYERSNGSIPVVAAQRGAVDRPAGFETASVSATLRLDQGQAGLWSFRAAGFFEDKGAGLTGAQSAASGGDISAAYRREADWGDGRVLVYAQARDFSNQTGSVSQARSLVTPALDQTQTPTFALGGALEIAPAFGASFNARFILDGRRAEGQSEELFRYLSGQFTRTRVAGGSQDLIGLGASFDEWSLSEALTLSGTLRLDHWANRDGRRLEQDRQLGTVTLDEAATDRSGRVFNGRIKFGLRDDRLALTLYRTFRPPSLNELHRPFRVGNDVTEANAALAPEILNGVDISTQWRGRAVGGSIVVNLVAYANRINDPIANVTIGSGPGVLPRVGFLPAGGTLRERQNVGQIEAVGVEASANWRRQGGGAQPEVQLAFSTTDASVDGGSTLPNLTGKRPAQAPDWSGFAQVRMPLDRLSGRDIWLQSSLRAESARFEDDQNTRKLQGYTALDARVSWRMSDQVELFIAGENLTNQRIETVLAGDGTLSAAPGRTLRVGFQTGFRR